ncbi:MAG: helix-turn-helix transcriptional regulator [Myxococcaceae bacterium]
MLTTTTKPNPVREIRNRVGLSQVQLAVKSGVSLSTLRLAELGLASGRTLEALARTLEVTVEQLVNANGARR